MARGLRDESSGRIDARTDRDTLVDGALEPEDRTTEVTHGRKTPHQSRLRLSRGHELEIVRIGGHQHHLRRARHDRMPMRVDQAGHQHAPGRRNRPDLGIGVDGDRACRYARDDAVFDQDVGGRRKRGALTIEDANILKKRRASADRGGEWFQTRRFQIRIALRQARPASPGHERCSQNKRCCTWREFQYADHHEADLHREVRAITRSQQFLDL